MSIPQPDPARGPRPQDDDGTYHCYREDCTREAEIATPRRIESTDYDPVEAIVTFCGQCWLASEVMRVTRAPLDTAVEPPDSDTLEAMPEDVADEIQAEREEGWHEERLYPRLLANIVLHDDLRGPEPSRGSSGRLIGDIFDHAAPTGDHVREKFETTVRRQLIEYDVLDPEPVRDTDDTQLDSFGGSDVGGDDDGE